MAAKHSDAEARKALIAATRALVARHGQKFSLKQLFAKSGVGRADFYRCFAGKAELFAALAEGDVAVLTKMVEAMAPEPARQIAVNESAAPPVDAWLERRLRVFERALAALENRQDQSMRSLQRGITLLEEKLAATPLPVVQHEPEPVAPESVIPKLVIEAPESSEEPEPQKTASAILVQPVPEPEQIEESAEEPTEEPIGEREIEDFIAHARAAAQRAVKPPASQARSLALPRWIAWMGVALVTLLVCAGLALGNVAGATQAPASGGVAYRAIPHDLVGRLTALADSGDARAQTLLAMAYLHGQYFPSDDHAALRWSTAAAEQGEPVAQYLLGALLSKDDAPRAFSWFQEAALHGNLKAMHNLAIAYAQGQGVTEDDSRAAAWFGRAAAEGYVDSQFDLAVLFERGQGVKQNRVAALKWYLIAAAHGDEAAASRAVQLRGQMPAAEAARATAAAAAYAPEPRDQLANAVASPSL